MSSDDESDAPPIVVGNRVNVHALGGEFRAGAAHSGRGRNARNAEGEESRRRNVPLDLTRIEMEAGRLFGGRAAASDEDGSEGSGASDEEENNLSLGGTTDDEADAEEDANEEESIADGCSGDEQELDDERAPQSHSASDSESDRGEPHNLEQSALNRKRRRAAECGRPQERPSSHSQYAFPLMGAIFGHRPIARTSELTSRSSKSARGGRRNRLTKSRQPRTRDARSQSPSQSAASSISGVESEDEETPATRTRRPDNEVFAVPGVRCVGCCLGAKVASVDAFVEENAARMPAQNLWRLAALQYQEKVVKPCQRAGVTAPEWPWEQIWLHYEHHHVDPRLQGLQRCRELRGMRTMMTSRILVENDSGDREIDGQMLDRYQKLVQLEQREYMLLSQSNARKSKSTAGPGAKDGEGAASASKAK